MGRKTINDPDDLAQVNVRMTIDFKKECDDIANSEGISLNEWIRRAMRDRLYLATGKDITPEIVELPSVYREIVNSEIAKNTNDIKGDISNIENDLVIIKKIIHNLLHINDPVLRSEAVENIVHRFETEQNGEYKGKKIIFSGGGFKPVRGNREGWINIYFVDSSGKAQEKYEIPISSDDIDKEIILHGDEIIKINKIMDDELMKEYPSLFHI